MNALYQGLNDTILAGDMDTADFIVNEVTPYDAQLALELRKMMKRYQFDEMQEIIEKSLYS